MKKHVIEFFKRNPNAVACHIVLDTCYASAKDASRAKKHYGARKVTVVLRQEYDAWLQGQQPAQENNEQTNS